MRNRSAANAPESSDSPALSVLRPTPFTLLPTTCFRRSHYFSPTRTGPSSNGRTSDFGSENGGSNPPGPIGVTDVWGRFLGQVDPVLSPHSRPALWSHGTGADVMPRIAAPMVGGMVTSTVLTLVVIPVIYFIWRRRSLSRSTGEVAAT